VTVRERDDVIFSAQAREETFESDKYAWIDAPDEITLGAWTQLRQKDHVNLRFPYISQPWVASLDDPVFTYIETLLELHKNIPYEVTIEVKGEDAEKNTVCGQATKKITIA
jgi:hypothetical protein